MSVAAGRPQDGLTPVVPQPPHRLEIDFPGLAVGVAEYEEGPTGCTVMTLDRVAAVAVDVRGGMPGVFNERLSVAEAFCLAGGSILGLAASSGVATELFARRGSDPLELPAVTGGVIYDYALANRSAVYPDAALGAAALQAAEIGSIPLGTVGAGRAATCGKLGRQGWSEPGGQGAAFAEIGRARMVVLTVVNALGVVVDRQGEVVRGNRNPETGERSHVTSDDMTFSHERQQQRLARRFSEATTLTVVVTDARLGRDIVQLSRQIHVSMARVIQPFHCTGDGDTLWLASTNAVDRPGVAPTALAATASELAWDAVLRAVTS
jgi:L-aminopeptidase/D-esterase-like protein